MDDASVKEAAAKYFSQEEIDRVRKPWQHASSLPPRCYYDPEFYRLEEELIFKKNWLCIGRVDQIPNVGDYFTITLMSEPWIVVRNQDQQVNVISRICRHRWMPLVDDDSQGNTSSFRCPYHSWNFALDGQLLNSPRMSETSSFNPQNCNLPRLKTEIWNGFIFVNYDHNAIPLKTQLGPLNEKIKNYKMSDLKAIEPMNYQCPSNWKIMVENASEIYHVGYHRDMFGNKLTIPQYTVIDGRNSIYSYNRIPSPNRIHIATNFSPIQGLSDDQYSEFLLVNIFPTCIMAIYPDQMSVIQTIPESVNRHKLQYLICYPSAYHELEQFRQKAQVNISLTDMIHRQDMELCERVQIGLQSNNASRYSFSHLEAGVWQFQNFILDKMLGELVYA